MTNVYDTAGSRVTVFDTAGQAIWGAPDPVTPVEPVAPSPPEGPLRNVATWCNGINLGRTPASREPFTVSTRHDLTVDVVEPVFQWVQTKGFVAQEAGASYAVTVSHNGSTPVPVTVAGQPSFRLEVPGSNVVTITSDPVPIAALAGDRLDVAVTIDADGGTGSIPSTFTGSVEGRDASRFNMVALRPTKVLAPSDQTSWLAVGDSITQSVGWSDQPTFMEVGLGDIGVAFTKSAQGGDSYRYQMERWAHRTAPYLDTATHVVDGFGINDAGSGFAKMCTDALAYWSRIKQERPDVLVFKTTLFPAAGTTDNWATLEGQTPTREPARSEFNAWLRDGAPISQGAPAPVGSAEAVRAGQQGHPLAGIADTAASVEEPGRPGYYNAAARQALASTSHRDGLHPNKAVHAITGAALAAELRRIGY